MQAAVAPADKAIGASGLFLASTMGAITGLAASSAVMQTVLRFVVHLKLTRLGLDETFIEDVRNDPSHEV
jgi:hypothetical protein